MTDRWEYKIIELAPGNGKPQAEHDLNSHGAAGWELVAVSSISIKHFAWLKRHKLSHPMSDRGEKHAYQRRATTGD